MWFVAKAQREERLNQTNIAALSHRLIKSRRVKRQCLNMTANDEYLEFLDFLFAKFVRPRIPRVRHRFHHHLEDEWYYHLDQVQRAAQVLRYIESYCVDDKDVYRTFTEEKLLSTVADTRYSLEFSNRVAEEAGFVDAFEAYSGEILAGLHPDHLPGDDKEVLKQMGSLNPDVEIRLLVQRAKTWRSSSDHILRNGSVSNQLRYVEEQLAKDHKNPSGSS
jgi:hypothetical protein